MEAEDEMESGNREAKGGNAEDLPLPLYLGLNVLANFNSMF